MNEHTGEDSLMGHFCVDLPMGSSMGTYHPSNHLNGWHWGLGNTRSSSSSLPRPLKSLEMKLLDEAGSLPAS